jgi:hypothetical protein
LPADGGDYVIAGRAAGHADWQATVHVAIERTTVDLEVPRLAELPPVSSPAGPTSPAAPALPPEPPPAQPDRGDQVGRSAGGVTSRRVIALGVAGVGLVGVTAGVVLGEAARGKQRDAFKLCPDPMQPCFRAEQSTALVTSGHTYALEANLAYGLATAAVIGAAVLWFTGAPGGEPAKHVRVVPRVSPGEAGVVASGSF